MIRRAAALFGLVFRLVELFKGLETAARLHRAGKAMAARKPFDDRRNAERLHDDDGYRRD